MMKKTDQKTEYALAWYKPEQWDLLKAVSVDKDILEDSFVEWEASMIQRLPDYEKEGIKIQKMVIDVDELVAWCKLENIPVDGDARAHFAAKLLMDKNKCQ